MLPTDERVARTERALLKAAHDAGYWVSGDGRVNEETAADLLGYAYTSLAALRHQGQAPRAYRIPAKGGKISYRLSDLAEWVETRIETP